MVNLNAGKCQFEILDGKLATDQLERMGRRQAHQHGLGLLQEILETGKI
jgi:hypothetical protein